MKKLLKQLEQIKEKLEEKITDLRQRFTWQIIYW